MDSITGERGPDGFQADLNAYRRLRYQLAELESKGDLDEALIENVVAAEDRLMAAAATSLTVVLTKFEIAASHQFLVNRAWFDTIRTDLMLLCGLDSSPLGAPLL